MRKTRFDRLTMILRSSGFLTSKLIRSQNAVNFAYILYLRGRAEKLSADDLERLVRRWYAMSVLTRRYSGSPESTFDFDIRQIEARGVRDYVEAVIENEHPGTFWTPTSNHAPDELEPRGSSLISKLHVQRSLRR